MATQYSDLLAQTVMRAGDINPGTVAIEFRRRIGQFMEQARVWRSWIYSDMAASLPGQTALALLQAASVAAAAAAAADQTNVALQQAAAAAAAAASVDPYFELTRPVKAVGPPAVSYSAIANPVLRVSIDGRDVFPFWRVESPSASGAVQRLYIGRPYNAITSGAVKISVNWVPLWDATPENAVPDWVFERYGADIMEYTIGCLWADGFGRKGNLQAGRIKVADAMVVIGKARSQADREDPVPTRF